MEAHNDMQPNWFYEVTLFDDYLRIKQKVGGKAEMMLEYGRITDVFWGRQSEIVEKKQSPIARAFVGGFLFGGAGAIVGAMTAGTKEKTLNRTCFLISYDDDKIIQFEDAVASLQGKRVAEELKSRIQ